MPNKCKKGFTLTELAIVIAVIAILVAVLVPTFISLISKANISSDEQTVKNLNTALTIEEADGNTPEALCQVWGILEEAGYNPTPTPNYSDNQFYWYKTANRVVIVSISENEIIFPSQYEGTKITEDTASNTSLRLTAAKATADTIYKSALVWLSTDTDDSSAHNFGDGTKDHDYVTSEGVVYSVYNQECSLCSHVSEYEVADSENSYLYAGEEISSKYVYDGTTLVTYYIDDSIYDPLYEKYGSNDIIYEETIEIPYGTTAIASADSTDDAVFSVDGLYVYITSIKLPDTLTSIGNYAFYDQSYLESIEIPASVTEIGNYAFENCGGTESTGNGLKSVIFDDSSKLETIGYHAFYQCNQLKSITIPSNVKKIGYEAFYNCTLSEGVTFKNTDGWYVDTAADAESGTDISSNDLIDASNAATLLKTTYLNYYWYRSTTN